MGKNRIEEIFRDPTLEQPSADYYVVRHMWGLFHVDREMATRILAAMCGPGRARLLRVETITGSVVFIRTDAIAYVRESTRAQRKAEERFWKMLDDEEDDEDEKKADWQ